MSNEMSLDSVDREIIELLRRDGRMSNVELARHVGLTPPPCLRRVRRLEEAGVIAGYRARIDPGAEGRGMEVLVAVEIRSTGAATLAEFERAIASFDEVLEARRVFGIPDYFLRVAVADAGAYEHFQSAKLANLDAVHRIVSHQTMKLIKDS